MEVQSGTFNGTGAALYLGLGFIPDKIELRNLESSAEGTVIKWSRDMARSGECLEGVRFAEATNNLGETRLTYGQGVAPYRGGDLMTAASTVYLVRDPAPDKRAANAGYDPITTWTLGVSANRTGNWNAECSTTHVGEGSMIRVKETISGLVKEAVVVAVTSNGEQANEVTLSEAISSGEILFLGAMYDFSGAASGALIPAGIKLSDTTLNASGNIIAFEAVKF